MDQMQLLDETYYSKRFSLEWKKYKYDITIVKPAHYLLYLEPINKKNIFNLINSTVNIKNKYKH